MAEHKYRDQHWAGVISAWRASGLSQKEFCRQRGIAERALNNWLYKSPYRERAAQALADQTQTRAPEKKPSFVPVSVIAAKHGDHVKADRPAIEIVLASGPRITVRPGFDEETLRRVVAALETRPC